jgi:hypothetical protein
LGTQLGGGSPLLVLVNSKSGDNHGLRVLRKFKRLLNPAQVFDIITGGPDFAYVFSPPLTFDLSALIAHYFQAQLFQKI